MTRVRVITVVVEKQDVLFILSVSVVLVVQYEKRMHSIIHVLSCVTYPNVQYFPTLSQKRHNFRKKVIEKKHVP